MGQHLCPAVLAEGLVSPAQVGQHLGQLKLVARFPERLRCFPEQRGAARRVASQGQDPQREALSPVSPGVQQGKLLLREFSGQ